jgi:hypothetical protein
VLVSGNGAGCVPRAREGRCLIWDPRWYGDSPVVAQFLVTNETSGFRRVAEKNGVGELASLCESRGTVAASVAVASNVIGDRDQMDEPETDTAPSDSPRQLLGASSRPGSGPLTDEEIEGWAAAIMDEIVRSAGNTPGPN